MSRWVDRCPAYLFDLLNYCIVSHTKVHYSIVLNCIELNSIGLFLFELSPPPRSEHQFALIATNSSVLNTSMLMTHPLKVNEVVEKEGGRKEGCRMIISRGLHFLHPCDYVSAAFHT